MTHATAYDNLSGNNTLDAATALHCPSEQNRYVLGPKASVTNMQWTRSHVVVSIDVVLQSDVAGRWSKRHFKDPLSILLLCSTIFNIPSNRILLPRLGRAESRSIRGRCFPPPRTRIRKLYPALLGPVLVDVNTSNLSKDIFLYCVTTTSYKHWNLCNNTQHLHCHTPSLLHTHPYPQQGQYLHCPNLPLMLDQTSIHAAYTNCWTRPTGQTDESRILEWLGFTLHVSTEAARYTLYLPPLDIQSDCSSWQTWPRTSGVTMSRATLVMCLRDRSFCGLTLHLLLDTSPEVKFE